MPNCQFEHTAQTPKGPVRVQWECPAPKNTAQLEAMFAVMVKHFPPTPEQLAVIAARERLSASPSPKTRKKRRA